MKNSSYTKSPFPLLLVTGISGAGKSSTLKILEDLGYEAVDNLPVYMIGRLVADGDLPHPIAIGIDIRTRDFGSSNFLGELDHLLQHPDLDVTLLFLDCDNEILGRRFEETRRLHPLTDDLSIRDSLRYEREKLSKVKRKSDVIIDTSDLELKDLKRILGGYFALVEQTGPAIFITSFSFRRGLPREADLVFDVRFLRNPHYDTELRSKSGRNKSVANYIEEDRDFKTFFNNLTSLIKPLIPRYAEEGKNYLTIAIGCTGGRHRSVFVAERLSLWLNGHVNRVQLLHRDLDRLNNSN
jgi:UPF0042 nucleotide-binding protein